MRYTRPLIYYALTNLPYSGAAADGPEIRVVAGAARWGAGVLLGPAG